MNAQERIERYIGSLAVRIASLEAENEELRDKLEKAIQKIRADLENKPA